MKYSLEVNNKLKLEQRNLVENNQKLSEQLEIMNIQIETQMGKGKLLE